MTILPYLLVKFVVYVAWCYLGVRLLDPDRTNAGQLGVMFGSLRLLLGMIIGIALFFATASISPQTRNALSTYFLIYLPVHLTAWWLLESLIRRAPFGMRAVAWIAGGTLLSCLADIPLAIAHHGLIPVGRPFC